MCRRGFWMQQLRALVPPASEAVRLLSRNVFFGLACHIYKRYGVGRGFWERRTARGLSPPLLQTAKLLWVNIWWEMSVRQQSEPVLAFPFVVSGRLLHSSLIYLRISKNSSNFKGPLMEIWLWEDLRLVFRCENDSEIDHHRLQEGT